MPIATALLQPFAVFRRSRHVIWQLTVREVRERFSGSLLGAGWLVLQPLLSLAVFWFVFGELFQVRAGAGAGAGAAAGSGEPAFVLQLFCGMVAYAAFADPVARAPRLVLAQPAYVEKTVFPLEVLPLPPLFAAALNVAVGLLLLGAMMLLVHGGVPWTFVLLPLVVAPLFALAAGAMWLLASLGVFVRDVQEIVRVGLQLLFFLSPVVWRLDDLPPELRPWALLNPLVPLLDGARRVALEGRLPAPGPWAAAAAFAVVVAWLGLRWFRRTKVGFADVM